MTFQTFDARLAAATALKSFSLGLKSEPSDPVYLPFLSALFDALNDDDDDIRSVAAAATSAILGRPRAALEAAEDLLGWLQNTFQDSVEFRAHVVHRMAGHLPNFDAVGPELVALEAQLQKAMDFDDSLFAIEEQNLFVDELREARRWCRVFDVLQYGNESSLTELSKWAEAGLVYLLQLSERDDGPLGWTSNQHVFAICVRAILCASAVAKRNDVSPVSGLLHGLRAMGKRGRLHGFLLSLS